MIARYAIYYAPAADHPLTRMASAWLGYDAWTAQIVAQPTLAGVAFDAAAVETLTKDPRLYGFHATLKAPFALATGHDEAALIGAFDAFAATRMVFDGNLVVRALHGFIALVFDPPCRAMDELHAASVRAFEPFRAPLSDADLARRRRSRLTADQDARLVAYGYPWIFEDFRFHMTLAACIADKADRAAVVAALARHFKAVTGQHRVSTLCLFKQDDRNARFRIVHWAPMQSGCGNTQ
jgi:hypothetical protein